ncbi:alcohol dehydrogenase catalytic domain-containing protein [Streptomyces mutabilis]|uniref:alcohol dehydrogenase catalytic domain-containing protein n=1 Tax=Streptomyces mutabilis TaxID=67332 RepID=UPI00365B54E9
MRAGLMRQTALPDLPMPFSPGFEVAGTVADVGPGVDPATVGRRVVSATSGGGYAEWRWCPPLRPCPALTPLMTTRLWHCWVRVRRRSV